MLRLVKNEFQTLTNILGRMLYSPSMFKYSIICLFAILNIQLHHIFHGKITLLTVLQKCYELYEVLYI